MHPRTLAAPDDDFERLVGDYQARLLNFIFSLVNDAESAKEVLQNTNIVLWQKRQSYEPGSNFKAWAFQVAWFEAKNYHRKRRRENRVSPLTDEMLDTLNTTATAADELFELRREWLLECLKKLKPDLRELILERYYGGVGVKDLAQETGTDPNAVAQTLFRIRRTLQTCIERQEKKHLAS